MKKPEPLTEYYIAYFDFLGYKEYFKEYGDKIQKFLFHFNTCINYTIGTVKLYCQKRFPKNLEMDIKVKVFSDNVLICIKVGSNIEIEKIRLLSFMLVISEIQQDLFSQCCVFVRGAVTKGLLSFNEDFVFGEGLIEAVEIEGSTIYPRIEISKAVMDVINSWVLGDYEKAIAIEQRIYSGESLLSEEINYLKNIRQKLENCLIEKLMAQNMFYKANDEKWSLSYLYLFDWRDYQLKKSKVNDLIALLSGESLRGSLKKHPDIGMFLDRHRQLVETNVLKYSDYSHFKEDEYSKFELYERVLKKYIWLLFYHNDMCEFYNKIEHKIIYKNDFEKRHLKLMVYILDEHGQSRAKWYEENPIFAVPSE